MQYKTSRIMGRSVGASVVGLLVGAFALANTGEAKADTDYFEFDSTGNSWVIGNSEFRAQATIFGQEWAKGYISDNLRTYETMSQDLFAAFGNVFGKSGQLISTVTRGDASSRSGKYATTEAQLNVMGSRIWTGDGSDTSACPSSDTAAVSCARYDKNWSKTFYSIDKDFPVSIFTVNVKASVKGGVGGHVSSQTVAMQGLPANKKHHLGIVNNDSGSGAYATAYMSAGVGLGSPDVLGVGVTGAFTLISVTASNKTNTVHRNDNVIKTFMRTWKFGFDVTSMNGYVDVWAVVTPLWKPTNRLINIGGFSKYIPIDESSASTVLPSLDP